MPPNRRPARQPSSVIRSTMVPPGAPALFRDPLQRGAAHPRR